ncbi:MAG: SBBP repeat-containing protein [Verrucomicrobiia bacterium]
MKTTKRFFTFIAAAAAIAATHLTIFAQGGTWETVCTIPGENDGWSVLIDPASDPESPTVLIGTQTQPGGPYVGAPSIWRVESGANPEGVDAGIRAVKRLAWNEVRGKFYAVGCNRRNNALPVGKDNPLVWTVRSSSPGSSEIWFPEETWQLNSKGSAEARGVTVDDLGNVYVCGLAYSKNRWHWIVRKFDGSEWSTVCNISSSQGECHANAITFVPETQALFAVGRVGPKWTVLRSIDYGASWVTVDSWSPGKYSTAVATGVASNGTQVFVVGHQTQPIGSVLRVSDHAGDPNSFGTPDSSTADLTLTRWNDVAVDASQNVWLVGGTRPTQTADSTWVVLSRMGGEWQAPVLPFVEFPASSAWEIATDGQNVFVVGWVLNAEENIMQATLQQLITP